MNESRSESARRMADGCFARMAVLYAVAKRERSHVALYQLVSVATGAAEMLHALWKEDPNIDDPVARAAEAGRRREFLRYFIEPHSEIPLLYRRSVGLSDGQAEIVNALEAGPIRSSRRNSPLRRIVDDVVMRHFHFVRQASPERPEGIDGEIWDLPPLSKATARDWASTAVRWLWLTRRKTIMRPGSKLYTVAKPERELARDKRRLSVTLSKRHRRWLTRDGGNLGAVNATKLMVARARIDGLSIKPRHVREGLRAQILGHLKRNLER